MTLRIVAARAIIGVMFVAWAIYATYGVYIAAKLNRFRNYEPIPKRERWNPDYYPAAAGPWIRRDRLWSQWKWPVLLGLVVLGDLLYLWVRGPG